MSKSADGEKVDIQCTHVKRELYKLKEFVDAIEHETNRAQAQGLFETAYADIDALQSFIKSR